jgi:hypothetical protein
MLSVELAGSNDYGPCKCCGNMSRRVWGFLVDGGATVAVYYVHWTIGRVDHGASINLIIGRWGAETTRDDRAAVAVAFRIVQGEPQFMVVDAASRSEAKTSSLAANALQRTQVIGTPVAQRIFAMLDAIWLSDNRISELSGNGGAPVPDDDPHAWPFDQPRNCATITMKQILDGSEPILLVTHDLDDHGWQFIGSTDANEGDGRVVALEEMVKLDPSIIELADLPPGWQAIRNGAGKPWVRRKRPLEAE